ncbi:hypothetical protein P8C59_004628 [Phyllachora maydis]|uniref:Elongation of fatty acids protein n=1 Tax=Phyllachora maydis TaxID=1825666 RepID=A0AAD9I3Z4_9PEZI|nr:hypothetical protein P8C59_004628 [Phyllachora maydis]
MADSTIIPSPSAFFSLPPASLFAFPPTTSPAFLLPPPQPGTAASVPPFPIPEHVYHGLLDPRVPVTVAALYAVTAKALNAYNKSTGRKPWALSQTATFRGFVIAHNIVLALYSAWTFRGMLGTMRRSMVSPWGPAGLAGFADSVCRLNGPAGLGRAAFYDDTLGAWRTRAPDTTDSPVSGSAPSPLDAGRIWNEGLAFYGWLFYLSKFYEVLDTLVILAKGKLSSTLQTYHHAGAIMCMWAGMRYMSPPIWMFVLVNSGIHAIMYTYYTLTAFHLRVPMSVKRTLTSLQITQFLVGASYAMLHSFVGYYEPVMVTTARQVPAASNASHASHASHAAAALETSYAQVAVPCITTSGATFAIWLNVLYLAPLTYLFASFFVTSYLRRSSKSGPSKSGTSKPRNRRLSNGAGHAENAGWDAARGVEREVYGQGQDEAVVRPSTSRG